MTAEGTRAFHTQYSCDDFGRKQLQTSIHTLTWRGACRQSQQELSIDKRHFKSNARIAHQSIHSLLPKPGGSWHTGSHQDMLRLWLMTKSAASQRCLISAQPGWLGHVERKLVISHEKCNAYASLHCHALQSAALQHILCGVPIWYLCVLFASGKFADRTDPARLYPDSL